jgi:hypothetical protein
MGLRRTLVLATSVFVAMLAVIPTAEAAPTHTAEVFICDGEETTIFTAGRNGWVEGVVKYHAVSFSLEGTFTPTGGEPQPVSETKVWGGGMDLGDPDAITCTADISEQSDEGLFEGRIEVIAVPA